LQQVTEPITSPYTFPLKLKCPEAKQQKTLILTHDVDWPRKGPGKNHILSRQERFVPEIINRVKKQDYNPYYGIPAIMETEEKYGFHSTFFFRPIYDDDSTVEEYKDTIKSLQSGGWEVGLHANKADTLYDIYTEKRALEKVTGQPVQGYRAHCLRIFEHTFANLAKMGIKYDSSVSFNKETIDPRNTGHLTKNGVTVFPITFMDAYLFTYMGLNEETIVPFMIKKIKHLFEAGSRTITLLWHDNSLAMKGGRVYPNLIQRLAREDITFLTGIQAFDQVQKQKEIVQQC
jgi:peptidoglycan/xylan/chitin deacetylase (PgdA/CDA1 family)